MDDTTTLRFVTLTDLTRYVAEVAGLHEHYSPEEIEEAVARAHAASGLRFCDHTHETASELGDEVVADLEDLGFDDLDMMAMDIERAPFVR